MIVFLRTWVFGKDTNHEMDCRYVSVASANWSKNRIFTTVTGYSVTQTLHDFAISSVNLRIVGRDGFVDLLLTRLMFISNSFITSVLIRRASLMHWSTFFVHRSTRCSRWPSRNHIAFVSFAVCTLLPYRSAIFPSPFAGFSHPLTPKLGPQIIIVRGSSCLRTMLLRCRSFFTVPLLR
jgi:hypothetical protein